MKYTCDVFTRQAQAPFRVTTTDLAFYDDCCEAAKDRGIQLRGAISILPYLPAGVDLASKAYGHLTYEMKIYIALYTAAANGLEDTSSGEVDSLKRFTQRFVDGRPHGNPILDSYDILIRELPDLFEPFAAEAMLESALDFCAGLVTEYELVEKPSEDQYQNYLRHSTGISRLYATSGGSVLRSWIEALPSVIEYVE